MCTPAQAAGPTRGWLRWIPAFMNELLTFVSLCCLPWALLFEHNVFAPFLPGNNLRNMKQISFSSPVDSSLSEDSVWCPFSHQHLCNSHQGCYLNQANLEFRTHKLYPMKQDFGFRSYIQTHTHTHNTHIFIYMHYCTTHIYYTQREMSAVFRFYLFSYFLFIKLILLPIISFY